MENLKRNEMLLKIAGKEILLRPTFENMAAMESKLGSLSYLVYKFTSTIKVRKNAETGEDEAVVSAKDMPAMTDVAQIIYFNQAATKAGNPTVKEYSLDDVWEMVQGEGMKILVPVTQFLLRMSNGNNMQAEPSAAEKKS